MQEAGIDVLQELIMKLLVRILTKQTFLTLSLFRSVSHSRH